MGWATHSSCDAKGGAHCEIASSRTAAFFSRRRDPARFTWKQMGIVCGGVHARSLAPLVKARDFGMTPVRGGVGTRQRPL
jgi:hypothetical protein